MMTQEDGFIEVQVNLFNRTPIVKWVRPVYFKKLPLLFDVYCLMIISMDADVEFSDLDNKMNPEELLAWIIYGGYKSYTFLQGKRSQVTIDEVLTWVKGMLNDDRIKVMEVFRETKAIGKLAESYQKARNPEGEEAGQSKKAEGSVPKS
jgi:hypothetical protein